MVQVVTPLLARCPGSLIQSSINKVRSRRPISLSALTGGHRVDRVLAGKEPDLRLRRPPPVAQEFQQLHRQHDVAVPLPLPCSTRSVMRWLSMSDTFRFATSDTRRPAP